MATSFGHWLTEADGVRSMEPWIAGRLTPVNDPHAGLVRDWLYNGLKTEAVAINISASGQDTVDEFTHALYWVRLTVSASHVIFEAGTASDQPIKDFTVELYGNDGELRAIYRSTPTEVESKPHNVTIGIHEVKRHMSSTRYFMIENQEYDLDGFRAMHLHYQVPCEDDDESRLLDRIQRHEIAKKYPRDHCE